MLREIDDGRTAPRRGLAAAWLGALLSIAGAPVSQAGDWTSTLRAIGETIGAAGGSGRALAAETDDLPLPPYPPPISGLDTPPRPGNGKAPSALVAPPAKPVPPPQPVLSPKPVLSPSPSPAPAAPAAIGTLMPPPLPAPAGGLPPSLGALLPAPLPAQPPSGGTLMPPPPLPAPTVAGDGAPDVMRSVFAKAAASPFFPRLLKPERQAVATYYEAHGFKPLWHQDGALTPAAHALLDRLAHAAEEGLDPDDYAGAATPAASTRPEDVAEAEWRISAAALAYARDARGARVTPSRLSVLITPALALPGAEEVFGGLTQAEDAGLALRAFNPHADGYLNLRTALAKLRADLVPPSPEKSEEREATRIASVAPDALKGRASGKRALAVPSPKRVEADIIANMERWRWLPPELGERYILVNVPEFTLRYINNGVLAHEARVIVGKPTSPTPIFSGEMKFLVVNPSWYIPPSILKKEFLPKLAYDPLYAETARLCGGAPWRPDLHPTAAGGAQCARPDQIHVPQRALRLSARHTLARLVRAC